MPDGAVGDDGSNGAAQANSNPRSKPRIANTASPHSRKKRRLAEGRRNSLMAATLRLIGMPHDTIAPPE